MGLGGFVVSNEGRIWGLRLGFCVFFFPAWKSFLWIVPIFYYLHSIVDTHSFFFVILLHLHSLEDYVYCNMVGCWVLGFFWNQELVYWICAGFILTCNLCISIHRWTKNMGHRLDTRQANRLVARDSWITDRCTYLSILLLVDNPRKGWKIHGWGGPIIWKEGTRATERGGINAWGFLNMLNATF